MKQDFSIIADIAEYAAMNGISYDAAVGVFVLTGWDGLRAILNRQRGG